MTPAGRTGDMARSFPLRRPTLPWRWLLRLIGVGPGRSQVELTADGMLRAAFGRLGVETRLDNVCGYRITGPYRWWRSIGPRASLADHGFTFSTSTHGGVCLCFRDRVPTRYVRGGAMEALTVTVDDIDGFARALEEVGITGRDERAV